MISHDDLINSVNARFTGIILDIAIDGGIVKGVEKDVVRLGGGLGDKLGEKLGERNRRNVRKKFGTNSEEIRKKFGESSEKSSEKTTPKTTPKTKNLIMDLIRQNPEITKEELAKSLNLTSDGIKYNIRKLKKKGFVQWVGSSKGGHWEVVKSRDVV